MRRDSPVGDTAWPWHSHPLSQQHWLDPSPILWPQAPAQPQHGSTYPARLAEAPLEQWVEGGWVPPPAGQTAVCGTERAALTQGRDPLHPTAGCRGWSLPLELCLDTACPQNCIQMGPALGTASGCGSGSPGSIRRAPCPPQHPALTALPPPHGTVEKGPKTLAEHSQHLTPLPRRDRASDYLPASRCCS